MFFRENNFVISPSSSNIARGKPYNDFNHMEKKTDDILETYGQTLYCSSPKKIFT